ncbi:MAG: nodulation protein NfeD [Elusimicrobia bacterium]|nr:nodulation protein NfeD [Elusimicrobiota bacterium]
MKLAGAALLALLGASAPASAAPAETAAPRVLVAAWNGAITPVSAEFMESAIRAAEKRGDDALVLELDTPGGLDGSMRATVKAIMSSKVPVVAYVAPSGARAASAGVFIVEAAHVAAMAPGTNIGAAHPIELGAPGGAPGGKPDSIEATKMTNDAAAYLASIAAKRGRNESWARWVVDKSSSITAGEAVRAKVVDLEADDLPSLLARLDGRRIPDLNVTLRTKGAAIERFEPTKRERLLMAVVDPNVAMVLMTLGMAGLLLELYHPGLVLPGVVGLLCLLTSFYAFQTLSANMAGVLLMLAGMVFLVLELHVVSYGLLALAGIASILLGATLMFQAEPGLSIARSVLFGTIGGFVAVLVGIGWIVAKVLRRGPRAGASAMIGRRVKAFEDLSPAGRVSYGGELWKAESLDGAHSAGEELEVADVRELTLLVRRRR